MRDDEDLARIALRNARVRFGCGLADAGYGLNYVPVNAPAKAAATLDLDIEVVVDLDAKIIAALSRAACIRSAKTRASG
ncbi:hypothetical protein IVB44_06855 [Bradyrhizobium sp. 49]|uniref:hypothetical protein n=1 Tax=unclassified Bradyrhizobium TaxID=2631580 RepID=UPI001FFBEF0F|nr:MULTISPECIES: hypothetical protein [unclassified Bradyrhizobium]MCK1266279.1 hypothetical protein [Bradyrhizobium sp. 84]MCK1370761.1 hypothetical protein [Bradyrhizobium sp. 49]